MESFKELRVAVTGACGKVGREMVKAVVNAPDLKLVGAVDRLYLGEDIGEIVGLGRQRIMITESLEEVLVNDSPDVIIDFTNARAAFQHISAAVAHGVSVVSGSTGFSTQELEQVHVLCEQNQIGAVIAPNFALGAVLMFRLSQEIAKWFDDAEIIELHNDRKLDAPSGTALRTASLIQEQWKTKNRSRDGLEMSQTAARGDQTHGLSIHSVRLPGLVAHQEVIFGALGQALTIRHDSYTRESFVPGVMLAVRKVKSLKGVVFGLENLIF